MALSRALALCACALPGVELARTMEQKCRIRPGGAGEGNSFSVARDGPAGNVTARERCFARVMAMPATRCKVERTARELCAHSYIFVGGLFHSGTGVLRRALAEVAPTRVSIHEKTHTIEDEGKYMQTVYAFDRDRDAKLWHCAFIESKRDELKYPPHTNGSLWRDASDALASAPRGSTLLFAQWARFWDLAKPILVEKTPMNMLRVGYLDALFPEMASFAVIVRHPFGTCAVQLKIVFKLLLDAPLPPGVGRPRSAQAGARPALDQRGRPRVNLRFLFQRLDSILAAWCEMYERFEADASRVARAAIVRFEPMLADPSDAARRTLRALGFAPREAGHGRALNWDKQASGIDSRHASAWHWQYGERFAQLQWLSRPENGGSGQWAALVRKYEERVRWYGYSLRNLTSLEAPVSSMVCM